MKTKAQIENCPSCNRVLRPEDDACPKCGSRRTAQIAFDTRGRLLFAALVFAFWTGLALAHAIGWSRISSPRHLALVVTAGFWGLFFVFIPGNETCSVCGRLFKWKVPGDCPGCGRALDRGHARLLLLMRGAFALITAGTVLNSVLFLILCLH